jgi:ABC-type multidrug transport system permease subunit
MKKLNLINWFLILLLILSIAGMAGNIVAQYSSNNKITADGLFWFRIISNLMFYMGLSYAQRAIYLIKKEVSFTNKSNDYFNKSALFLILSSIIHSIVIFINYTKSNSEVSFINLSFYFLVIVLALFIYAIGDIVKLGKSFQEENELTV